MLFHKLPRGVLVPRKKLEDRLTAFVVGRIVERQSPSIRGRGGPKGAKTPENLRTIWQGERKEQFHSSRWRRYQQQGKHWRLHSWHQEHWPRWQPSRTPTEDFPDLANEHVPAELFELDKEKLLINLRTARRSAAAGPPGMTSDHFRCWKANAIPSCLRSLPSRWQRRMFPNRC